MNCKAYRVSDQMICECGLQWDMNDPEPPICKARRGTIMQTAEGEGFDLGEPSAKDIRWEEIANSLSRICRFNGHLPRDVNNYTVAQHCCHVADLLPPKWQFAGLLHDAHEAYIGDWTSPLKAALGREHLRHVENPIELVVQRAAGIGDFMFGRAEAIHRADMVMLATERRDLLATGDVCWGDLPEPRVERVVPWSRHKAYDHWMIRFNKWRPCPK